MAEKVDGRRARGDRTRLAAATAAADMATLTGLDSISMSILAKATGLSASGILTVFDNRQAIQLAAVAHARDVFAAEVITPAWGASPGVPRLSRIIENWFGYVERRVFPGGCFLVAASAEYGAQKGPVAEAVREMKTAWLEQLEGELRVGQGSSKEARNQATFAAYKLEAAMAAADVNTMLTGDEHWMTLGRRACCDVLDGWPA